MVYNFNYITVVTFFVSTHSQNCPNAPLPPYDNHYRHRILTIVSVAPQPPYDHHYRRPNRHSCAASAIRTPLPLSHPYHFSRCTTSAAAAPLLRYDQCYRRTPPQYSPNHPQYFTTMYSSPKGQTDQDEGIFIVTFCSIVTELAAPWDTCVGETLFYPPTPLPLIQILILSSDQGVKSIISPSIYPIL